MRVGVVIPVRNRPSLVLEALDSVRAQSIAPARVVVVDDGSTDSTPDAIAAWLDAHRLPGWELVRSEHRGAAEARQLGYAAAGEIDLIAFLDSDDLWPPDMLRRAVGVLRDNPGAVGVSADRRTVDESTGRVRADDLRRMTANPLRWLILHDAGFGSCSVIRADAVRSLGGYPTGEPTGHDILFFSGLVRLGPWAHMPLTQVTFRRHHAPSRGEADHIYKQIPDANIRYARLYERVVAAMPAAEARSGGVRRSMSRRWFSAARTAYTLNDALGALECLSQVRRYQRVSFRASVLRWKLKRHPQCAIPTPPC